VLACILLQTVGFVSYMLADNVKFLFYSIFWGSEKDYHLYDRGVGPCVHKIEMRHSVIYVFEAGRRVRLSVRIGKENCVRTRDER
jgi:hypothetical protein